MQTATSWTRENTTGNNFLYNGGTELNATTGVYDLHYRNYDPVLGRMNQVDPMASKYAGATPYNYAFNAPTNMNDPLGDDPGSSASCSWCNPKPRPIDTGSGGGGGGGGGGSPYAGLMGRSAGFFEPGWQPGSGSLSAGAFAAMDARYAERTAEIAVRETFGINLQAGQTFCYACGDFAGMSADGKVQYYYNTYSSSPDFQGEISLQNGGGALQAGTEDGANWNLYYASSTLGMFGYLRDNDSFWMGKNNRFYSKSLLYRDYWGAGGKYVKGVQGYRASANLAASTSSKLNSLGRKIGIIGVGVSVLDGIRDGQITEGDILRVGISIFTVVSPIGWAYGLADLSTQIITGTSITDRISNEVDRHVDVVDIRLWKH